MSLPSAGGWILQNSCEGIGSSQQKGWETLMDAIGSIDSRKNVLKLHHYHTQYILILCYASEK